MDTFDKQHISTPLNVTDRLNFSFQPASHFSIQDIFYIKSSLYSLCIDGKWVWSGIIL
jgi:hypothetical protein